MLTWSISDNFSTPIVLNNCDADPLYLAPSYGTIIQADVHSDAQADVHADVQADVQADVHIDVHADLAS